MSPEFGPSPEEMGIAPPGVSAHAKTPEKVAPPDVPALPSEEPVEAEEKKHGPEWDEEIDLLFKELEIPEGDLGNSFKESIKELLDKQIPGTEKITPEQLRALFKKGIHFMEKDEEMDPKYQAFKKAMVEKRGGTPDEKYFYAAHIKHGKLTLFPAFGRDPQAAHILRHELGHMLEHGKVLLPTEKGETNVANIVDFSAYKEVAKDWKPEWNSDYVGDYASGDPEHYYREMLSDHISNFLVSHSYADFMEYQLRLMSHNADIINEIRADPKHPFAQEIVKIYNFLQNEFATKLPHITETPEDKAAKAKEKAKPEAESKKETDEEDEEKVDKLRALMEKMDVGDFEHSIGNKEFLQQPAPPDIKEVVLSVLWGV